MYFPLLLLQYYYYIRVSFVYFRCRIRVFVKDYVAGNAVSTATSPRHMLCMHITHTINFLATIHNEWSWSWNSNSLKWKSHIQMDLDIAIFYT